MYSCYAIMEQSTKELMVIFSRVGIPREILTDQGSNFQSQLLRELYRLLHVDTLRTSPYHPQTDGLAERFNQTLKSMLCKAASTGFSPFELMYGRDVLDILKDTWTAGKRSNQNVIAYVLMMRERLEAISAEARNNSQSAKARQKMWYDKIAREHTFQQGDKVLVLLPTSSSKLDAQWQVLTR